MNIARLFSYVRLLEREAARERVRHRVETARLKRELLEWQSRALTQAGIKPLPNPFAVVPPKPETKPTLRAPVGQSAKRAYLAEQAGEQNIPTAEQVLGVQ
jgi:hypothetical protein